MKLYSTKYTLEEIKKFIKRYGFSLGYKRYRLMRASDNHTAILDLVRVTKAGSWLVFRFEVTGCADYESNAAELMRGLQRRALSKERGLSINGKKTETNDEDILNEIQALNQNYRAQDSKIVEPDKILLLPAARSIQTSLNHY